MKRVITLLSFGLLLCFAAVVTAGDTDEGAETYSIWLGGHYTDFQDYNKKVGEYRLLSDNVFPEFRLDYFSQAGNSLFRLDARYFDYENVNGRLHSKVGDRFKADIQYRSLTRQLGQDLLENMSGREWLGPPPGGGKYITHTLDDVGADYNTQRNELKSSAELVLSHKHDLKLIAAHRMIAEDGSEQAIGNSHCFSCHVGSQSARVDKRTQSVKAGLEGRAFDQKMAYTFGYRKFQSRAAEPYFFYDEARHPINGGSIDEFGSRENYDNESLPINGYPATEKMSHKVTSKGMLGSGQYALALTYSRAENVQENFTGQALVSEALAGRLNYTRPLSQRSRLVAKLGVGRINNDDPFIDLPLYRDGRSGPRTDFDYVRYSTLDRSTLDASAEMITRLSPKLTLSLLGGIDRVSRDDYPVVDGDNATTTMIGQLKVKYTKGTRYSFRGKYRFEKTSDPFTSGRGLFELSAREELPIELPGFPFRFYFEREALRYQDITTEPTDYHEFGFQSTWRPNGTMSLLVGFKGTYDKNGDLDSLDVKHTMFQPNVNVTLTPNPQWTMVAGYTYTMNKSRGPIAVALFDG